MSRSDRFTWKKGDFVRVQEGKPKKGDRSGHMAWGPTDLVRVDNKRDAKTIRRLIDRDHKKK